MSHCSFFPVLNHSLETLEMVVCKNPSRSALWKNPQSAIPSTTVPHFVFYADLIIFQLCIHAANFFIHHIKNNVLLDSDLVIGEGI